MIKLLFLLLLDIVIVLGQSSDNDDAASSCYSNLDEISMKELEISIHRRNKTTTPWITSVEEQEEQQQEQQGVVDDVPVELRRYILCPNTTFTIGTPLEDDPNEQDAFYVYEGGSIPLLVINPNMELWCGHDGNVNNNCVLEGGEYQIVSSKVLMPPALRDLTYHVNPTNFTIKGVTMRGSTYRSVQMGELGQDYGILFQNCIFEQQYQGKFVIYIQTLGMNIMGGIESTAQAQEQDEEEEEAAQEEEEDSTGRQLRRNKNRHRRRRRRHLQDEQQQQQQSGPSDTIGEPDEIVTLPADEEEESNNNNDNSTTTTTTTEETADEDQHVNVGAAIQNASQQLQQQQQEEEEEENGQEENGPAQLLGEPDPTLPPTQIPAEQQEEEEDQQQSDGPAALGELDPTLPPTQIPAEQQQQQQDISNMIATTSSTEMSIPMNPLSGIIELASSTSNLLQITFDGCLFRNNIVEHAIMGINDAVELYLSNNIFLNNTVGKKERTIENENGEDTTTFFRDSSIIELNDPLPSLYVENNCWMNNTYGASPLLLEHGTLSQEGFEELDLSENVNGNHVELVDNVDNDANMIYCPNQMLVIAPSQDDLLQINSPSLNERLDRGAYICVDMDIRQECMASIYESDMMMDDTTTTTNTVDTSASNNNNVDSSSSSSNNNASKSIKVTVILLTGSFLLFGIGFLCWTSARRQKVQREEYINRVLQDHAQP